MEGKYPAHNESVFADLMVEIRQRLISARGQQVLVDSDVARLHGVETRRIDEDVRNNPR